MQRNFAGAECLLCSVLKLNYKTGVVVYADNFCLINALCIINNRVNLNGCAGQKRSILIFVHYGFGVFAEYA